MWPETIFLILFYLFCPSFFSSPFFFSISLFRISLSRSRKTGELILNLNKIINQRMKGRGGEEEEEEEKKKKKKKMMMMMMMMMIEDKICDEMS